jgi:hypothetical protein
VTRIRHSCSFRIRANAEEEDHIQLQKSYLNGKNVAKDTENASFLWGVTVRTDVVSVGSAACNVGVTSRHVMGGVGPRYHVMTCDVVTSLA